VFKTLFQPLGLGSLLKSKTKLMFK